MPPDQPSLFTKRTRKARSRLEFSLHVAVADVLRRWSMPGWVWTHLPFGEYRGDPERAKITGSRLKRMGTQKGWPDFILLSPMVDANGADFTPQAHFLELKREGAKLTEEQRSFEDFCHSNGYPHFWTDNFKDAINQLKQWGAVRASVNA